MANGSGGAGAGFLAPRMQDGNGVRKCAQHGVAQQQRVPGSSHATSPDGVCNLSCCRSSPIHR